MREHKTVTEMNQEEMLKPDPNSRGHYDQGSCRFCCQGIGKNIVFDKEKQEVFYICDKHKAQYNITADKLTEVIK